MSPLEEVQAELLDEYLSALQSGNQLRCQSLLADHPELQQYAHCLENLHDLTAEAQTLPPQPRLTPLPSSLMLGTASLSRMATPIWDGDNPFLAIVTMRSLMVLGVWATQRAVLLLKGVTAELIPLPLPFD